MTLEHFGRTLRVVGDEIDEGQSARDEWFRLNLERAREVATKAPTPFPDHPIDIIPDENLGYIIYWHGLEDVLIQLTMCDAGEGLEINRVMISGSEIDSTTLRKIPIALIREVALARLSFLWTYPEFRKVHMEQYGTEVGRSPLWSAGRRAASTKISRRSRRTRSAHGDDFLHIVALEYSKIPMARGNGGPHEKLSAVLSKLTGREIDKGAARDLVFKTRARGFLLPTKQGRASNQLGDEFFTYKNQGEAT